MKSHLELDLEHFNGVEGVEEVKAFLTGRKRWGLTPDYWSAGKSPVGTYQALFDSVPSHHRFFRDEDGTIQAYLWLCPQSIETVDGDSYAWRLLVHPEQRTRDFATALIDYAEEHLPLVAIGPVTSDPMRTVAYESDTWLASLLEARGYLKQEALEVYMVRDLASIIAKPAVADGYSLRAFNPGSDIIQRSGVQSDAFAGLVEPNDWSIENTRRFIRWSENREDLDLAAVATSGEFAAFALFLVDPVTLMGELDPVGTRHAHRRKGLSKALLLSGLKYLKTKGMKEAVVRTVIDNYSAIKLYESVGFRIVDKLYRYVNAQAKI